MSTIISRDMGIPSITIYAPESRTIIEDTIITKHLIKIVGHAYSPFIHRIKFIDCVIVADDLCAFNSCCFDESCTMNVKRMTVVNNQSINDNLINIQE